MGYRIDYSFTGATRMPVKKREFWSGIAAAICICTLVLGAIVVKNTAFPWVRDYLLPGDPVVTAAALENMADSLKAGEPLLDAVTAFCREIVENAS